LILVSQRHSIVHYDDSNITPTIYNTFINELHALPMHSNWKYLIIYKISKYTLSY
jgi:hypothetical protein